MVFSLPSPVVDEVKATEPSLNCSTLSSVETGVSYSVSFDVCHMPLTNSPVSFEVCQDCMSLAISRSRSFAP